jgi:hypothetical protein
METRPFSYPANLPEWTVWQRRLAISKSYFKYRYDRI